MAELLNAEDAACGGSDAHSLVLTATSSFSSILSSSDLDTESTTSFFPERGITLGSLIGIVGGARTIAGDDHSSLRCSSAGGTTSSQSLSFSHMSCMCGGAKLWSLLQCGSCRGFCDADKGTCRGFCYPNKGSRCVGSSATTRSSSSLGHFLVAERDAERSLNREAEGSRNEAKVYINIMYEESGGTGHDLQEAAINPLFDVDTSPATAGTIGTMISKECKEPLISAERFSQSRSCSTETGLMPSLYVHNELLVRETARMCGTASSSAHAAVAPGCPLAALPVKGQKALSNSVRLRRCGSYMWTRC